METPRPVILFTLLSLTTVGPLWAADSRNTSAASETRATADGRATRYAGPMPRYTAMVREITWYDATRDRPLPALIYYPSGTTRCPVVLFSTGLGRSRDDCAYLGRFWASCGYVAVHLQHKGSDEQVRQGTVRPKKQLRKAFDDPGNIRDRPRDMIFAINELERMKRRTDPLGNRLDLERIGASGHDFGAQTALALAGQVLPGEIAIVEPRVKAVVAMSSPVPLGQVPLAVAYGDINVPCLHITGTDDNSIVATTQASQRRLPFDYTHGADEYLIIFQGADHRTYSGHPLPRRNAWADGVFQQFIAQSSTAFWDAYLKGDADAKRWLADGGLRAMLGAKATLEQKIGR
jgi:predicted dienelactone hydrolase